MRTRVLVGSWFAITALIAVACGQTESDSNGTKGGSGGATKGGTGGTGGVGAAIGGAGGSTGGVGAQGGSGGTTGGTGGVGGVAGLAGSAGSDASVDAPADSPPDTAPEAASSCGVDAGGFQLLGPIPYLSLADSPIKDCVATFYLEDFEDHSLNQVGLSVSAGFISSSGYTQDLIDSVDGDDGVVGNGICFKTPGTCDTWFYANAAVGVTFSFNTAALGGYPTVAGLVWTDGMGQVTFQAYGPGGVPLGKIGPLSNGSFPDMSFSNTPAEDRFFGIYNAGGISAISIANSSGAIEVDHVQYGM